MTNLINGLFPAGHRKLLVSIIALALGFGIDQFGGGLSDNLTQSLIAIVAIFAGGNVMEHLAEALKFLKGSKLGEFIEEALPGDQGLGDGSSQFAQAPPVPTETELLKSQLASVQTALQKQEHNMGMMVQIINQMRGANGQAPQTPTQPAR